MLRLLFSLLVILTSFFASAQNEIKVFGLVKRYGEKAPDVTITVYKNSFLDRIIITRSSGLFKINLDLNNIYLIEASRIGHYPVKVNISTIVPPEKSERGVAAELNVTLHIFEKFPDLHIDVLQKPIAQIKFYPEKDQFDYDQEYFASIKNEIDRLYNEVDEQLEKNAKPLAPAQSDTAKPALAFSKNMDLIGRLLTGSDKTEKKPLANSPVDLLNAKDQVVQAVITDQNGNFRFLNLNAEEHYTAVVRPGEAAENVKEIYLANQRGEIIKKLFNDRGAFKFSVLPSDQVSLAFHPEEDPWLVLKKSSTADSLIIREQLYYDLGKSNILPEAAKKLDKLVEYMLANPAVVIRLVSHTDSRSSSEYNLTLSKARASAAVSYVLSKGIPSTRISGVGLGEARPVNYCVDGVICTESQHQENRRTEFVIVQR